MSKAREQICFTAKVARPKGVDNAPWAFLNLPKEASDNLPSRGMTTVEGTVNDFPFVVTLEPDGLGGHWMRVNRDLLDQCGAKAGDTVKIAFSPVSVEPEPKVPADFLQALDAAEPNAKATWESTTAVARRDWIFWVTSGKKAETREKRIGVAISKMSAGSRRPCCFDRSGMYDKSLSCPVDADE